MTDEERLKAWDPIGEGEAREMAQPARCAKCGWPTGCGPADCKPGDCGMRGSYAPATLPQPDPDAVALAEMAAWWMAQVGRRVVGQMRDGMQSIEAYWPGEGDLDGADVRRCSTRPTIGEAWARIKQQEGFPR